MLKTVVTIFWIHWAAVVHAQPLAEPVDRAVALVDNAVVTASDLRLHASLGAGDKSFVPILNTNPDRILEDAILAAIIQSIAGRVSVYQPNPAQVRARLNDYRSRWTSDEEWKTHLLAHGLTPKSIFRAFQRRLVIERVVSRAIGVPQPDGQEQWNAKFEEWINRERQGVRVRMVPSSTQLETP